MLEKFKQSRFLTEDSPEMRTARTIAQGIVSATAVFLPQALDLCRLDPAVSAYLTALGMAILSPIMAVLAEESKDVENGAA